MRLATLQKEDEERNSRQGSHALTNRAKKSTPFRAVKSSSRVQVEEESDLDGQEQWRARKTARPSEEINKDNEGFFSSVSGESIQEALLPFSTERGRTERGGDH